ncbi:MAG: glutamine-hydrolyzing GMP synthase [Sphaerochaetaceae bacterium]|jgi:GMP synthase (glutamine-hydrolysing)
MSNTIAIVDFSKRGGQLVARLIRLQKVKALVTNQQGIKKLDVAGVVVIDGEIEKQGYPVLNISYDEIESFDFSNFLFNECKVQPNWDATTFVENEIKVIQKYVGDKEVLCALSGGVDSSVVAALLHKAIGNQLTAIFVDTGLLRENEAEFVETTFKDNFKVKLIVVDAKKDFFDALKGVSNPEAKRKIIGNLFIEVFEREAKKLKGIEFLAQGTLYTDILESVAIDSGEKVSIKSHHNVGGLPEKLNFKLVEPLKELFKDEVREVGKALGLSDKLVYRHPFPGPGLAVRCIGEVTPQRVETLRKVDAIFIDELYKADLYDKIWQSLATLLPVKSVGVKEGRRVFEEVCTIRAINSIDATEATIYPFDYQFLAKVSKRICSEVDQVSRVLYDITDKPPSTIEWE